MRLRALASFSVASLVLLGACGDDGGDDSPEAQTFCSVVAPIQQIGAALEVPEDVAGLEAAMTDAEAAFATVAGTPPEAIASDVNSVQAIFTAANEALAANAYSIDAASAAAPDAINAIYDVQFQTSADNIQAWSEDNC
jgi:hypothetical protein